MKNKQNNPSHQPIHERLDMTNDDRRHEVAELEAMFAAPDAVDPLEDAALPETPEATPQNYSLRRRIGAKLAPISLMSSSLDAAGRLNEHFKNKRAEKNEKYAVEEGDTRRTRLKKFLGRNATRIAAGALVGLGAGVAYGLRAEHTVEAMNDLPDTSPLPNPDVLLTAHTRYIVGGRGDGSGQLFEQAMRHYDPTSGNSIKRIEYSGQMAPLPGDTETLDHSSQNVSDQLYAAYQSKPHGQVMEIDGYSLGTQGALDFADRIKTKDGSLPKDVILKLYAPPQAADTGMVNTPYMRVASPLLDQIGYKKLHNQIPKGTIVIANDRDVIANSGGKPITTQAAQGLDYLFGDGHGILNKQDKVKGVVTRDGVTYVTIKNMHGEQNAALDVLDKQTNVPITNGMRGFANAVAPQGLVGQEGQTRVNADQVVTATDTLVKEGLNDRGITNANQTVDQIAAAVPRPVLQQGLDLLNTPNDIGTTAPVAPAVETATSAAITPAAAPIAEQAQQVVNSVAEQAAPYIPPQAQPIATQAQNTINGLLGGLPK